MECNVRPCEGWEKYIFFEFCAEDSALAYPIIERLALENYRVWYRSDCGSQENAERLKRGAAFIFVLSPDAAEQHGFLSRLIYAVGNSKPCIIVRAEKFPMTIGLMRQLDAVKHFDSYGTDLYESLLGAPELKPCRIDGPKAGEAQLGSWRARQEAFIKEYKSRGAVSPSAEEPEPQVIPTSEPDEKAAGAALIRLLTDQVHEAKSGLTRLGRAPDSGADKPVYNPPEDGAAQSEATESAADEPIDPTKEDTLAESGDVDELISEMTVRVTRKNTVSEDDPEKTVRQAVLSAGVLRLKTGELFVLRQIENIIGRKSERKKADIMLNGNPELSREHAVIYQYQGKFLLRDCGSLLGTFVGGQRLEQDKAVPLSDMSLFSMAGEDFLFLTGSSLKTVRQLGILGILTSEQSGECRYLGGESLRLDRNHPWRDGLLAKNTISRNHAEIYFENGAFMIRDLGSANGSYVNASQLEGHGAGVRLKNGDRIWVHDLEYRFTELELIEEGTHND